MTPMIQKQTHRERRRDRQRKRERERRLVLGVFAGGNCRSAVSSLSSDQLLSSSSSEPPPASSAAAAGRPTLAPAGTTNDHRCCSLAGSLPVTDIRLRVTKGWRRSCRRRHRATHGPAASARTGSTDIMPYHVTSGSVAGETAARRYTSSVQSAPAAKLPPPTALLAHAVTAVYHAGDAAATGTSLMHA